MQAAPAVRDGITRLAQALYQIDASPELALVRDRDQLKGRSATVAEEAAGLVDGLWTRYPQLSEAGEKMEAARARGDRDGLAKLLREATHLLRTREADAARAATLLGQLGTAWTHAVPRLDA